MLPNDCFDQTQLAWSSENLPLSYVWTLVSKPITSTARINIDFMASVHFCPEWIPHGTWVLMCEVRDTAGRYGRAFYASYRP